jgi:ribonuclease P protein component
MGQTLGKTERLHKRDFHGVRWVRSGKSSHFLLFKSTKNETDDLSVTRFGVVVSRKIKGAVKRNRIKRLAREFFRLNKHMFPGFANYSVRVMRLPSCLTWETVRLELGMLATRAFNE